jgi:Protein of unknown function (DUF3142)
MIWNRPKVWAANEVPIAFWSWRTEAPSGSEIRNAFETTNSTTLFVRAGQIDLVNGSVQRIRPVSGTSFPLCELHLVYNGTRNFLYGWDHLEPSSIARSIANTFDSDVQRTALRGSQVTGMQLDFDVPDRMLSKYAEVLDKIRGLIPMGTKLSITGLPAWVFVDDLKLVLDKVDFWIPQCYGLEIPASINERIPISSSADVERIMERVSRLDKPFYAGLSSYSYAILYAKDGSLVELRGDVDPASAAESTSFNLIKKEMLNFDDLASENRYVYQANQDVVLDGSTVHAGEVLAFDLPSSASLRASASTVRENAGPLLLGICLFRLPTAEDRTTLSLGEIAAALAGQPTQIATSVKLKRIDDHRLMLIAENTGFARSVVGEDAFTIELSIPVGSIAAIRDPEGFDGYTTMCSRQGIETARLCSQRRADIIQIRSLSWVPDSSASVILTIRTELPESIPAIVTNHVDDGRIDSQAVDLFVDQNDR